MKTRSSERVFYFTKNGTFFILFHIYTYKVKITTKGVKMKCKICKKEIFKKRIYCSNECKFSDKEYNKQRTVKRKINDNSKIIKCKLCDWESIDINNLSGALTTHSTSLHNSPFFIENFIMKNAIKKESFSCPMCQEWKTSDTQNKSGVFTVHLKSIHNINVDDFLNKYPRYKYLWKLYHIKKDRKDKLLIPDNRIKCEICQEHFFKLSNTHLKKHNISPLDYIVKYGIKKTTSDKTSKLQSLKANDPEIKQTMVAKIKETNQKKYGANSFTQTEEGMERVKKSLFETTYNNFLDSPKINEYVEMLFTLNDYRGVKNKKYEFRCKKCNNIFFGSLENGRIPRCLTCYPLLWSGVSKAEDEINNFLKKIYSGEIIRNDRKTLDGKELDFYIPNKKIGIEYNGIFWHSEINGNKDKKYHLNKTSLAENKGIHLIQIFEDEWIEKQNIVKNRLEYILSDETRKVYARNCDIKEIDNASKNKFLNENHIQGSDNTKIKLGAFYDNELVAVMTFGKSKRSVGSGKNKGEYELMRFATSVRSNGLASKLLNFFVCGYSPEKIISFADRRWTKSDSNLYNKMGFTKVSETSPSYWYFNMNGSSRIHRFNFRKKVLHKKLKKYDPNLTEWQNMQLNEYDRVWDCGNLKYELIYNK